MVVGGASVSGRLWRPVLNKVAVPSISSPKPSKPRFSGGPRPRYSPPTDLAPTQAYQASETVSGYEDDDDDESGRRRHRAPSITRLRCKGSLLNLRSLPTYLKLGNVRTRSFDTG